MPIVIQNIDRYVLMFRNGDLIIEDKIIHPKDFKVTDKKNVMIDLDKGK